MHAKQKKILIIGGISWKNTDHPQIGGTTVLMDNFIEYCEAHNVPHVVIPTNKYQGRFGALHNVFLMISRFIYHARKDDVAMVNISSKTGIVFLFPLVVLLSRLFGLEVVCRKFAGSIHNYLDASLWRKRIALWCLKKTKVSFFETEALLSWFHNNGYEAAWFPNVRNSNPYEVSPIYKKKLVFLAQVYEDKGIDILLRLSNQLPNDYILDIYGPITDARYNEEFLNHFRAQYKGVLKPEDVAKTLAQYNVMVFPTWWHSEGYPGVIIEALSVGMPVVSTRIGGIPEMIEDGKTGLLVGIKDEKAFEKAVLSIDQQRYERLREDAKKRFDVYNADIVNPRIVSEMME